MGSKKAENSHDGFVPRPKSVYVTGDAGADGARVICLEYPKIEARIENGQYQIELPVVTDGLHLQIVSLHGEKTVVELTAEQLDNCPLAHKGYSTPKERYEVLKEEGKAEYERLIAEAKSLRKEGKKDEAYLLRKEARRVKASYTEKALSSYDLTSLEYLHLNKFQRAGYKIKRFFRRSGQRWGRRGNKIADVFENLGIKFVDYFKMLYTGLAHGSWKTRISYLIMGFGSFFRKPSQWFRGILFLLFEVVFIIYMVYLGGSAIANLGTLGTQGSTRVWDELTESYILINGDNSFFILLWGVLAILMIVALIYTWSLNIKQNVINDEKERAEKAIVGSKDDLKALIDQDFYKTLLSLPLLGIVLFTVLPIIFMILVAFTNFDSTHQPPSNLFTWVGLSNFANLFTGSNGNFGYTFGRLLLWTLIWAFFATFTNYLLGMLVAMLINKKGIRLKKVWRTMLVFSIAIPQFISLLYVSKMFGEVGIVNGFIASVWGSSARLPFWTDATWAKVMVIIINIWVGIPYLMLITSGILMNIPKDLYESAQIDGASAWQQYTKITMPYMLFVTGPYLLTSFVSNINNFNVIYLLTGGGPFNNGKFVQGAGETDLLITWLYSMTIGDQEYKTASVIGILVFVVVAAISLIVYNAIPSTRNEEDFS